MKKKIVTIIGARPQIIKSAAINRIIKEKFSDSLEEVIVHTGQHYDENMSDVFFEEMNISAPDYNLNVGSSSHARQTAEMLVSIEEVLLKEKANAVLVYGDTNSTLAASTVASKLNIPVIHVEAGLRSFIKKMPEEVNRIVCDHLSTLLFAPTDMALSNLEKEGFSSETKVPYSPDNARVFKCGDVMYDNSLYFSQLAKEKATVMDEYNLVEDTFVLCTVHRPQNTDDAKRLKDIFEALIKVSKKGKEVVIPLHPRTSKNMQELLSEDLLKEIEETATLKLLPPLSFFNILSLEQNCRFVITDSGGVQKEAFFFKKPCVILRDETEWVEIVANGNAVLVSADKDRIIDASYRYIEGVNMEFPSIFGDGNAAEFICNQIGDIV